MLFALAGACDGNAETARAEPAAIERPSAGATLDTVGGDTAARRSGEAAPAATTATDRGPSAPGVPTQPGPGAAVQTRTAEGAVADTPATAPAPSAPPASSSPSTSAASTPAPADSVPAPAAGAGATQPTPGTSAGASAGASSEPAPAPATVKRAPVPFGVGERLTYDVKFGPVRVGEATMQVLGVEPIRGRDTYHLQFRVKGGTLVYKVDDRYDSWIDVVTLSSLKHVQDIDEGSYERNTRYDIFPERLAYVEHKKNGPVESPTVPQPLDDGSFIYFIRTLPELETGKTYTFNNYFRPDRNPVTIQVLRRERLTVPAGTYDAIVVRPTIKTKGVFGEGGRAEMWFSADSARVLLQMQSKLKFGSLNLYLRGHRPPATP